MGKLKKMIKDKKGMSYPLTVALVLALLIALCVLAEFFRLSIIAYGVRNALQESVISVATTNYNEVYDGLREGYSGGYFMTGDCWEETLDYGDVYTRLDRLLGTNPDGAYHVKWQGNGYEYRVTDLNVSISNAPFAPGNASQNFEADVSVQLEIPLSLGGSAACPYDDQSKSCLYAQVLKNNRQECRHYGRLKKKFLICREMSGRIQKSVV